MNKHEFLTAGNAPSPELERAHMKAAEDYFNGAAFECRGWVQTFNYAGSDDTRPAGNYYSTGFKRD